MKYISWPNAVFDTLLVTKTTPLLYILGRMYDSKNMFFLPFFTHPFNDGATYLEPFLVFLEALYNSSFTLDLSCGFVILEKYLFH